MTSMKPFNQPFVFSNLRLIGGGPECPGSSTSTAATASASATVSPSPNAYAIKPGSARGASNGMNVLLGTLGFIYLIFAL
jgi:hypothetical protein